MTTGALEVTTVDELQLRSRDAKRLVLQMVGKAKGYEQVLGH